MAQLFGKYLGQDIYKFFLKNGDLEVDVINFGGTITDIRFPDKNNKKTSLIAGLKTLEEYLHCPDYRGAILGRVANRIENAKFTLNGKTYNLTINENDYCHHGGVEGFNKKVWQVKEYSENYLELFLKSEDGDQGFPGELKTTVKYTLSDNQLKVEFFATTNLDTIVNLSNQPYFNLNGANESLSGMSLKINSDLITLNDERGIPHGEFFDIKNTLYDFNLAREFICDLSGDEVLNKRGFYDNNFVLKGEGIREVSQVYSKETDILLKISTDQKGMQVYSGNKIGLALETQNHPNSINCKEYPSPILRKNEEYKTTTIFSFGLKR